MKKIKELCWTALRGALKELGLSKEKIDLIENELTNNIEIQISNTNINKVRVEVNNNSFEKNEIDKNISSNYDNKLSLENSRFLNKMINNFFKHLIDTDKLTIFTEEFTTHINESFNDLFYNRKNPSDSQVYVNIKFNNFIKLKISNLSNIYEEADFSKLFDLYLNSALSLELSQELKKLGFSIKRI